MKNPTAAAEAARCRTARPAASGAVQRPARPKLVKVDPMQAGGEVAYRVEVDGRPVGWVGDGRPWRGHRFGGRRWFACWREDGDTAARWDSGLGYGARSAALAALLAEVAR